MKCFKYYLITFLIVKSIKDNRYIELSIIRLPKSLSCFLLLQACVGFTGFHLSHVLVPPPHTGMCWFHRLSFLYVIDLSNVSEEDYITYE